MLDIEAISRRFGDHADAVETALKQANQTNEEIRARLFDLEQKSVRRPGGGEPAPETWGGIVAKSEGYHALAKSQSGKVRVPIETKTTITTGATSGGALAPSDRKFESVFWINPMSDPETGLCGAKTRSGEPCKRHPVTGKHRCRIHGGAKGSGAPCGERNGNWRGGRYSRCATPEQRREAWRAYWAEKRARNGATEFVGVPSVHDL